MELTQSKHRVSLLLAWVTLSLALSTFSVHRTASAQEASQANDFPAEPQVRDRLAAMTEQRKG